MTDHSYPINVSAEWEKRYYSIVTNYILKQ
jgi:hypothetical protein